MSQLLSFRKSASQLSGGVSDESVRSMALGILQRLPMKGSLLDYGAGKGAFLHRIHEQFPALSLTGADLFARPEGLPAAVGWHQQDLNAPLQLTDTFDTVVSTEVIEHLENPREFFRNVAATLRPGGALVLTMPNQESLRSYAALVFGGHFTHFLGDSYPAHITALLRLDLVRICAETGFTPPEFFYSDYGGIPRLPSISWQSVSFGLLRNRLFSDNIGLLTYKRDA